MRAIKLKLDIGFFVNCILNLALVVYRPILC